MMLFTFVLAAASFNAVTAAAEDYHSVLRGNLPSDTVESLADAHGRMLLTAFPSGSDLKDLAVMSGAGIVFTHPPTTIYGNGDVCADSSFTGLLSSSSDEPVDLEYAFDGNGEAFTGGCGPLYLVNLLAAAMAKTAKPIDAELGGLPFLPGTYYSASLTVAANTNVILDGGPTDIFLFQSGSTFVTGANTKILLKNGAKAENVLFVAASAVTTGAAGSLLQGSILAGSAVTLGAGSEVEGYVLATAGMSIGAGCALNSKTIGNTKVADAISNAV
jgi:hypothetical protein